jgi:RND family efflux transporter MFP subunit
MKKKIAHSTVIILFGITAYFFVVPNDERKDDESKFTIISVQRKDLSQSVIATGIIKPKVGAEVKVGAQVSGIVKDLYVEIGSKVKKNRLLAVIAPEVYTAKADLASGLKEEARIEKKYAEIEFNRLKSLHEQKIIPDQEFESAAQRFELARVKLKQADAEYDYAALQLSYTRIVSPIDGVISSISTQKGETVAASFSAPTFFTIIDLERLELWAYVDETDIGRIKTGQKVSFTVDTYPGNFFEGEVETIYPKADIQNNVVNYITVVRIIPPSDPVAKASGDAILPRRDGMDNKNGKILRPEMTATVEIFTTLKKNALVLPKNTVQTEGGKLYVNILNGGKIEKRNIAVGISDKKYYEILSGLSEKENVVLNSQELK